MEKKVTPAMAMLIMREFSRQNIPFNIKFISLNETEKNSKGIVSEENILLQTGYRRNQSKKSEILASFVRLANNEHRQFYWPLLTELNGRKITP